MMALVAAFGFAYAGVLLLIAFKVPSDPDEADLFVRQTMHVWFPTLGLLGGGGIAALGATYLGSAFAVVTVAVGAAMRRKRPARLGRNE